MTIKIIEGCARSFYPREIAAMHRNRKEVFIDRLGWVAGKGPLEIDRFDECNPVYLVCVDDEGEYRASLRLLPTTGPNMLRDVFSQLLDEVTMEMDDGSPTTIRQTVESATIWESSRICAAGKDLGAFDELLLGIGEVAVMAGLTQVVSVFDNTMLRLLRRRVRLDTIGTPRMIGGVLCHAALFDTEGGWPALWDLYDKLGVEDRVLDEDSRGALT